MLLPLAILFWRFGPYHLARLRAATRHFEVIGVEFTKQDEFYEWDTVETGQSFKRITVQSKFQSSRRGRLKARRLVWQALDTTKPAVVALPGWSLLDAISGLHWCVKRNVPAIVMSESTDWDEPRVRWKEAIKRRLVSLFSAGLAGGTPHADYLSTLGMPRDRIFTGYDIVDNEHFKPKAPSAEQGAGSAENSSLQAPGSRLQASSSPYFLASARFIEKKNLPGLIQAYARYRQMVSPRPLGGKGQGGDTVSPSPRFSVSPASDLWPLVILGDGPLRENLKSQISNLKLQDCVRLPGFKQYDELPHFYAQAGAFIHASTTEPWGLVVNEAMAAGLPVLVSNRCGCARDLVQEGVNGFTFDPYNLKQLAQLMLKVSTLHAPCSTLGAASRRLIADWGPERFATGLKSAVETALRVGPRRAGLWDRLLLNLLAFK